MATGSQFATIERKNIVDESLNITRKSSKEAKRIPDLKQKRTQGNNREPPYSSQKAKEEIFVSDPLTKAQNERRSIDEFKPSGLLNRKTSKNEQIDPHKGSFMNSKDGLEIPLYSGTRERRNSEETLDEGGVVFNDVRERKMNEEEEDEVEIEELAEGTAAAAAAKGSMKEQTEEENEQIIWNTKNSQPGKEPEEVVHLVKGGYDSEEMQDVPIRVKRPSKKEMMSQNAIKILNQDSKTRENFEQVESRAKFEQSEVNRSHIKGELEESLVEGPATEFAGKTENQFLQPAETESGKKEEVE